jgi:hypothetical protein
MSLCRYFRSDGFARGAKAVASILFGTPGLSGMCAFETAKICAGNYFADQMGRRFSAAFVKKMARMSDASN